MSRYDSMKRCTHTLEAEPSHYVVVRTQAPGVSANEFTGPYNTQEAAEDQALSLLAKFEDDEDITRTVTILRSPRWT